MKAKYYIGILSVLMLSGMPVKAQFSDGTYYGNDGTRIIVNNYYADCDYYYSSRINRFHRSYAVFDYYSPVFTDTYWYDYRPWSWGISIYRGGFGFNLGYSPYYYNNYYNRWYDPYYYDPYFYDSYYWGYSPRYYSYWYTPSICWGFRHLWADLTWGWFRPYYWNNYWGHDFGHSYYSHHNHYYDYNSRYSSGYNRSRYEASRHDFSSDNGNESRRGVQNNNTSRDIRNYDRVNPENGIRNSGNRRSFDPATNNAQQSRPVNRTYPGTGGATPSESRRSVNSGSGQSAGNINRSSSGHSDIYNRSLRERSLNQSSPSVRRQEAYNQSGRPGSISQAPSVRRQEAYSQPGRSRSISQSSPRSSGFNNQHNTRSMPQSITRSGGNNNRSHSVDMGRISRSSGPSRSMSASVRSSGSMSRGGSAVSHSRSSGVSRSSGSGSSGSSGNRGRR